MGVWIRLESSCTVGSIVNIVGRRREARESLG